MVSFREQTKRKGIEWTESTVGFGYNGVRDLTVNVEDEDVALDMKVSSVAVV